MNKPEVKIENWYVRGNHLYGNVQDHPRFTKDTAVKTSTIIKRPKILEEGNSLETLNTIYVLGKSIEELKEGR